MGAAWVRADADEALHRSEPHAESDFEERPPVAVPAVQPSAWSFGAAVGPYSTSRVPEALTPAQEQALAVARTRAQAASAAAMPELRRRFVEAGFSETDLACVLDHVAASAALNIHLRLDRRLSEAREVCPRQRSPLLHGLADDADFLDLLLATDRYHSAWELGLSLGSPTAVADGKRDLVERQLFCGAYQDSTGRPLYAALNLGAWSGGAAPYFGDAYLELAEGVRARTTISPRDSFIFGDPDCIGTLDHAAHVLAFKLQTGRPEEQAELLLQLVGAARGTPRCALPPHGWLLSSDLVSETVTPSDYVEVHVHGPVRFSHDVKALVVHERLRHTPAEPKLRAFADRHGVELGWHDATLVPPEVRRRRSSYGLLLDAQQAARARTEVDAGLEALIPKLTEAIAQLGQSPPDASRRAELLRWVEAVRAAPENARGLAKARYKSERLERLLAA